MPIQGAATAGIYTDMQGFDRLREEARKQSPDAIREVARQFESLMVQMTLKSMRDAKLADGIFDSDQSGFYTEMFDKQMALTLSQGHGLGLADILYKQLGGANAPSPSPDQSVASNEEQALRKPSFATPGNFMQEVAPLARQAGEKLGVDPQGILAQAALETGWGQHVMHGADQRNSHNLFGIKADPAWSGDRVTVTTAEYTDGEIVQKKQAFRSYPSYQAAFDDYTELLRSKPQYREALDSGGDAAAYARGLQGAGYATDPRYAEKIAGIIDSPTWRNEWDQFKTGGPGSLT